MRASSGRSSRPGRLSWYAMILRPVPTPNVGCTNEKVRYEQMGDLVSDVVSYFVRPLLRRWWCPYWRTCTPCLCECSQGGPSKGAPPARQLEKSGILSKRDQCLSGYVFDHIGCRDWPCWPTCLLRRGVSRPGLFRKAATAAVSGDGLLPGPGPRECSRHSSGLDP